MNRKEEAEKLTSDAKALVLLAGRSWTAYAAICDRMIQEKLYEEIGFENFSSWCEEVGDKSAKSSYADAYAYHKLAETLPEAAIAQMPIGNARDLAKVPESKITADLVQKATETTNKRFRVAINKAVPNLHLEQTNQKKFDLQDSALKMVNEALALAKKDNDIEDDAGALEVICQAYLAAEGQASHYHAAKTLVDTIEENVNPDKVSAPPTPKGWANVVVTERRMARIYGFAEKRVMPTKPVVETSARVQ